MSTMKSKKKVAVKSKAKVKAKLKTKKKVASRVKSKSVVRREKIQKKVDGEYLLTIYLNDQVFEAYGTTSLDAFRKMSIPQQLVKTKVVIQLLYKEKKAEQVIMGVQLKRILASHVAQEIWAKRVEMRLK